MNDSPTPLPEPEKQLTTAAAEEPVNLPERVLADNGPHDGPLLLVTVQVHGNEPAGRIAVEKVVRRLAENGAPVLMGRFVAICGNRAATAAGVRRIDRDLNRVFPSVKSDSPAPRAHPPASEDLECEELVELIGRLKREHAGHPLWFLDLHTTSSESIPYLSLPAAKLDCLNFAATLPFHRVSGFADIIGGTIDRYLYDHGFVGFACEGGRHDHSDSADNLEALIWLTMEQTGHLPALSDSGVTLPEVAGAHTMLEKYLINGATYFKLTHRHAVSPDDQFVMEDGFVNFSAVHRGQLLAKDKSGDILCPSDGHLLMPLYQSSGSDGFFLVEEVDG